MAEAGATGLADLLARRIRAGGPLTVAEYMAEALGHPRWGYYATRDPLGVAGDFITAPEVSQMFGELLGLWCADRWMALGRPLPVILAELGPGRGTLMADALRALKTVPALRAALRLHLVETSPVLRRAQAEVLATALPAARPPSWHASIASLPAGPLLLVANEFLDALPVHQLERRAGGWHERRIGLSAEGDALAFVTDPAPSPLAEMLPPALDAAPETAIAELRPAATALVAAIAGRIAASGGAALFIDYGYCPSGWGDTLQAVRRHRRHDPLAAPGSADLTAHVDFAALVGAAHGAGVDPWGPVTQGTFLTALGLGARAATLLRRATPPQAAAIASARHRLIDDAEMGTLFKVLALAPRGSAAPAGFPTDTPACPMTAAQ